MIDFKKVFDRIDTLEEEYVDIWEQLCLIESPTDYKKGVDDAGNYVIEIAKKYGWKIEKHQERISGDAICITMNPDALGTPVCLSGHLDTVHPVGLFEAPVVRRDSGNIYGPGVADCKGGIVAALLAMTALCKEEYCDRPVKLILQSDEETNSAGSDNATVRFMCECAKDSAVFLNCEPYVAGTTVLKRKGIAKYTFNITGKAAHAGICYEGVSAVTEAAYKVIELEKYKDKDGITANCGVIEGGTKSNAVPEKCSLEVDFRFSNINEMAEVKNIAKRVAETSFVEGTSCELVLESLRDAMELTEINIALLENVNEIFEKTNLTKLTYRAAGGGSDAAYTTQCSIPTLDSVGVECGFIHSKDEYAVISSLKESAKRIVAICCYI